MNEKIVVKHSFKSFFIELFFSIAFISGGFIIILLPFIVGKEKIVNLNVYDYGIYIIVFIVTIFFLLSGFSSLYNIIILLKTKLVYFILDNEKIFFVKENLIINIKDIKYAKIERKKIVSYSRGIDYSYYKDCLKLYYIINDIEKVFEFDDTMKISLKELEKEINKRII